MNRTTLNTSYPVVVDTALHETASVLRNNHALLREPEANAHVDADRMLVQSMLAQYRKTVEAEGLSLDELLAALADRAIEGMTIDQSTALSSLNTLMPEKVQVIHDPYSAQISRETPAMFLFGFDLSDSMNEPTDAPPGTPGRPLKLREVEKVLRELLFQLAIKSGEELPDESYIVKDYFHLMGLGYGDGQVNSVLPSSTLDDQGFAPLSALVATPVGEEDGKPVFLEPFKAGGNTPMVKFFERALAVMSGWSAAHNDDFPPTLINITDGISSDGSPVELAKKIQQIKGKDGNALVFNCHIAAWWPKDGETEKDRPKPILFPQSIDQLPKGDKYARELFEASSELPPKFLEEAKRLGLVPKEATSARAMAYNCTIESLVDFLVIGTHAKESVRD